MCASTAEAAACPAPATLQGATTSLRAKRLHTLGGAAAEQDAVEQQQDAIGFRQQPNWGRLRGVHLRDSRAEHNLH